MTRGQRKVPPGPGDLTIKKRCARCGKRKALDDFHHDRAKKDGRQTWCRVCMNLTMRKVMRAKAAELRAFRLLKAMVDVAIEETS